MDGTYYRKLQGERGMLEKMSLFKEIIDSIKKKRACYSDYYCTVENDVRFNQGYVRACNDIIGKTDSLKIINDIFSNLTRFKKS